MLLVLIILKLLFLPSNNNNFKLSFFPSFSFIFAFFAGIFAGVKEREKKKSGICCYRRGGTSFNTRRFLRKGMLRISFASTKICPPKQKKSSQIQ